MSVLDDKQNQKLNNLLLETFQTVITEYEQSLEELQRVQDIIADAASTLRHCFKQVDAEVRRDGAIAEDSIYNEAYRSIIATLQFEDIVTQIIGHQTDRSLIMRTVLLRFQKTLEQMTASELQPLQMEIDNLLQQFSGPSSVQQKNLAVGESELF